MSIIDTPMTDARALLLAVRHANERLDGQVWWRGDSAWQLLPSVYRPKDGYDERAAILRFQQRAVSRHDALPATLDRPAWLFLMQHHRFPTRLLDWTESPLIAAFFASEIYEAHTNHPDVINDADGALFALSPYAMNKRQISEGGLLMPEDTRVAEIIAPAFD
jgi:hypothetical protein